MWKKNPYIMREQNELLCELEEFVYFSESL